MPRPPVLPPSAPASELASSTPLPAPASYEAALAELDALIVAMESGQMPLEQLLSGYQRGAALLDYCRTRLQAVETQVKVLEEGQLKPWATNDI